MRGDDGPEAELAFAIIDAYHGQGLARRLIGCVSREAGRVGIVRFSADVLSENATAKRLLTHLGAGCVSSDGHVARYRVERDVLETRLATRRGASDHAAPHGGPRMPAHANRAGRTA